MAKSMENPGRFVTEKEEALSVTHGYARCSTNESKQNIDRQIRELKAAGAERIWLEYEHGDAIVKSQQESMLMEAHEGDTILVSEVSRLARSVKQLCAVIDQVRERHLRLVILGSITMDCRTSTPDPMTEAFLQIAGVFSQLELSMIRQRVRSGMENARAKGKQIGRPSLRQEDIPDNFFRYYTLYAGHQINLTELARLSGVSRPTVYRYLSLLGA